LKKALIHWLLGKQATAAATAAVLAADTYPMTTEVEHGGDNDD
jgi:hypothetical protein